MKKFLIIYLILLFTYDIVMLSQLIMINLAGVR